MYHYRSLSKDVHTVFGSCELKWNAFVCWNNFLLSFASVLSGVFARGAVRLVM